MLDSRDGYIDASGIATSVSVRLFFDDVDPRLFSNSSVSTHEVARTILRRFRPGSRFSVSATRTHTHSLITVTSSDKVNFDQSIQVELTGG